MSNLFKNLLIALGIALMVFGGYLIYTRDSSSTEDLAVMGGDVQIETQILLNTLRELNEYDTSGEFFANPLFTSLTDFRQDIGDEPSGRSNPFAPVQ